MGDLCVFSTCCSPRAPISPEEAPENHVVFVPRGADASPITTGPFTNRLDEGICYSLTRSPVLRGFAYLWTPLYTASRSLGLSIIRPILSAEQTLVETGARAFVRVQEQARGVASWIQPLV